MTNRTKYPIGIQTFEKIIEEGFIYVDKTEYVYNLTHSSTYVFLSRPRRFGKSLLTSTLEAYFEARKELFQNLKLGQLEKEWVKYPVFRFDMSQAKKKDISLVRMNLNEMVRRYERIYDTKSESEDLTDRLKWLYEKAYEQTGQKVVILIDEYDSPMLEVMHDTEKLQEFRDLFRSFYSPIKSCDQYIRFAFITGITKFSQLSIFSEINNLELISMTDEYSSICGITNDELLTQLSEPLKTFAEKLGVDVDEAFELLKAQYDGYHFSEKSEDIFNPFSLLNSLKNGKLINYWFTSGTPIWLIEQMRRHNFNLEDFSGVDVADTSFDAPTENAISAMPILFQSGYLTIKGYNPISHLYTLAFPNNEVRIGMVDNLFPLYVTRNVSAKDVFIAYFGINMLNNKVDEALGLMRSFLAEIPYEFVQEGEKSYHLIFFLIANLLCSFVNSEVHNSAGRTDMVIKTPTHIYVFEFKYDGKEEKALLQIDEMGYTIPYERDGREIVKIAVNFNSELRTIDEWRIE